MLAASALLAASWQPAPLVSVRSQRSPAIGSQRSPAIETVCTPFERVRTQRTPAVEMLLPKALAAVFFVPWVLVIVTNNLPEEQRLKIQKSSMLQGGQKMKSMKTVRKQPSKVKGVRLGPEVLEVTRTFKKEYPAKELESLWGALLKCYGTKERALAAVRANPQIVNPSYSFPNTILESYAQLLKMMSEAEALEVMGGNPAVLQCGPSLESLGASEIKSFAKLRSLGGGIPQGAQSALLVGFLGAILFPVLVAQNEALAQTGLLETAEQSFAVLGAPVFLGAILYLLKAGGG